MILQDIFTIADRREDFERQRLLKTPYRIAKAALFLDRDGVIIEDCHYIKNPDDVKLCQGTLELMSIASQWRIPVVVITNQSGISRGLLGWEDYEKVTDRMLTLLGPQPPIAAIYANSYGPNAPPGSWRKPSPAMLLAAAGALNLDLRHSLLIGDRLSDLQAGAAAGVSAVFHVLSGHGEQERAAVEAWSRRAHGLPKIEMLANLEGFPLDRLCL